ncbi:MAG: 23S rRNA (adenine(2503)-C(2))-methyltransferase RlmN [Ruminococcaceae bacterium]|nr:23S rRNA (adenine(2503)-C(2))-methyltransferase RlmN [Oscillospiraceae bacterium]
MNFYDFTKEKLEKYFTDLGENKAKAEILYKAIYRNKKTLEEIAELSQKTKDKLLNDFSFSLPETIALQDGGDTAKALIGLKDKSKVETVLMRHKFGAGLCVSTQVGCAMNCAFCQSGKLKKRRDLTAGEMVSQVLVMARENPINHISVMGIGEPLDNFDNVKTFLEILSSPYGFAFGNRHITLSTCGVVPMIERLKEIDCGFNLAISLHAPNDEIRSRLMPVNKRWGINELMTAVREYSKSEKKRIAFEYILLDGINDGFEQADELTELIKGIDCFVNLIPYNQTESSDFKPSSRSDDFFRQLRSNGVNAIFRRKFGEGINAACGQLSSKYD